MRAGTQQLNLMVALGRLVGTAVENAQLYEEERYRAVLLGRLVHDFRIPLMVIQSNAQMLEQVRSIWEGHCRNTEKELVVENELGADAPVVTDVKLVQQVLGNLIDNACKYTRAASDRRLWVRARTDGPRRLLLEVEDRGPGVPPRERRSIFRPFRRGRGADVVAGGVGLGLALAWRWARLLGGRLTLAPGGDGAGACFRLLLKAG